MNIKEFIVEAITQISQGISELKEKNDELGIIVNPNLQIGEKDKFVPTNKSSYHIQRYIQNVGFEISVVVTDEKNGSGGIGVCLAGIVGIGAKTEDKNTNENVSKLTFSIPVCLPMTIVYDETKES